MRSQIFGFHVETRQLFEGIFPHPYHEIRGLLLHHLNMIGGFHTIDQRNVTFGSPGMDSSVSVQEIVLNDWGDEVTRVIGLVHQACGHVDSIQRLEKMREALSFNWLKLHQSAAIAQIALGAMAGNETHLIMTVGWNDEADNDTIDLTGNLFRILLLGLRETKITYNSRRIWVEAEMEPIVAAKRPKYGIRQDTIAKFNELKSLRDKDKKQNGKVTLTRTEACEQVGLTVVTLQKHDRMLHERWYDMKY